MSVLTKLRRLPLTIRVPATVAILMVAISAIISERVLDRLSNTQETYLNGLASAYLDGIAATVTPSVLREDSWEVYDGLERMSPTDDDIIPVETAVTGRDGRILASSNPRVHPTLQPLDDDFESRFGASGVALDADARSGYARRNIIHQNQLIGAVYAVFDISSLLRERRHVLITLLSTNVVVTVGLGLFGFVAVRRMVRPMQVLETHMTEAAAGSATLIGEAELPGANSEAERVYRAYNTLVRSETERQLLTRKLAEEEKLASLGRMASGMAHEINNPLGGLMNAVDTLRLHGDRRDVRESSIELIQRGLQGIREVVEAALATYRPERLRRPLSEQDFVDLKLLVRPELHRKKQLLEYAFDGPLESDRNWPAGPIRQAVLNLLLNAIAATPVGGRVGFVVDVREPHLLISILDEGTGMSEADRSILAGRESGMAPATDSGLGLWIVREIANDLGSVISVDHIAGRGTNVSLSIPRKSSGFSHAA